MTDHGLGLLNGVDWLQGGIQNTPLRQRLFAASFVSFSTKILKTIRAAMECRLRTPDVDAVTCREGVNDEYMRVSVFSA